MNGIQKLIAKTAEDCINNNINFSLINQESVSIGEIKCSGYFDETDLKVATRKDVKDWVSILAHESCHLDQFLDKSPLWQNGENGIDAIDDWLAGAKTFSEADLLQSFINVIKLELDCEIRTVKKIRHYKIDIPLPEYIQKVNAYLFSYWATYRDKKWFPFPYNNTKIYKKLPEKFLPTNLYLDYQTTYLKIYDI